MSLNFNQLLQASPQLNVEFQAKQVSLQKSVKRSVSSKDKLKDAAVAYRIFKDDQKKWVKVMRRGRNQPHQDFTAERIPQTKIQSAQFLPQQLQLKEKMGLVGDQKLKEIQDKNQRTKMVSEQDRNERRNRDRAFFQQLKHKRIAKIKSKLYHKLKNRQKEKEKMRLFGELGEEAREQELERLRVQRIKERITLRHSRKAHQDRLTRFAKEDKLSLQKEVNEQNRRKKQFLQKFDTPLEEMNLGPEEMQQVLKEDLADLDRMEIEVGSDPLQFMKRSKQKAIQTQRKEAQQLLQFLRQDQQIETEKEGKTDNQLRKVLAEPKKSKQLPTSSIYSILGQVDGLTEGLNLAGLKKRLGKKSLDYDLFQQQHEQLFQNLRIATTDQNEKNFQAEKQRGLEQQIPQTKRLKGWGEWAGPSILPRVNKEQQLANKKKKIDKLRQERRDGADSKVIIDERRDKKYSQLLVKQLPKDYIDADHFDYANEGLIGPDFNSYRSFKEAIKPKVRTKPGESVLPVELRQAE